LAAVIFMVAFRSEFNVPDSDYRKGTAH